MSDLKDPTYEQLMEGAKRHLKVEYTRTERINWLELSENGVHDMVFAKDELGQASILARDGKIDNGVSDIVIRNWDDKDANVEHGESSSYKKRMIEAESVLEKILNTLNNPHDHDFYEIKKYVNEWESNRNPRYK